MDVIQLIIPSDLLRLSDVNLGREVRARMLAEIEEKQSRYEIGYASAKKKLGTSITIDGVAYDSRAQARKILGMSPYAFSKKYPGVP